MPNMIVNDPSHLQVDELWPDVAKGHCLRGTHIHRTCTGVSISRPRPVGSDKQKEAISNIDKAKAKRGTWKRQIKIGHRQTQRQTQEELILDRNPVAHCPRLPVWARREGKV